MFSKGKDNGGVMSAKDLMMIDLIIDVINEFSNESQRTDNLETAYKIRDMIMRELPV